MQAQSLQCQFKVWDPFQWDYKMGFQNQSTYVKLICDPDNTLCEIRMNGESKL